MKLMIPLTLNFMQGMMQSLALCRLMGLDVIPREEETGEVIDPRTASIVNLYRVVRVPSSLCRLTLM